MKAWMIVVAIVVLIILWFIATANKLAKKKMKAENAFSDMDVYLTKRYDMIPNIVNTVKGYAKHEKGTLEAVIKARNGAVSASSIDDKIDADNQVTQAMGKLFALAESYPDLKANQNFLDLQDSIKGVEKEIAGARQYYNAAVTKYNYNVVAIPDAIVASILHYEKMKMYEANAEQRENVEVKFDEE